MTQLQTKNAYISSNIIYYDFRNNSDNTQKTPWLVKATEHFNATINALCLFLCGGCMSIALVILALVFFG